MYASTAVNNDSAGIPQAYVNQASGQSFSLISLLLCVNISDVDHICSKAY